MTKWGEAMVIPYKYKQQFGMRRVRSTNKDTTFQYVVFKREKGCQISIDRVNTRAEAEQLVRMCNEKGGSNVRGSGERTE